MYTEQAIKKAIKGGYETPNIWSSFHKVFLDPQFWHCLGKSFEWNHEHYGVEWEGQEWLYQWHRFIDHLAEDKEAEKFFEDLLK